MKRHDFFKINVGDNVRIDDDKRTAVEEPTRRKNTPCGSEDRRFVRIVKVETETGAVAKKRLDRRRKVVQVDRDVVNAVVFEVEQRVFQHRSPENREHRFGRECGQWTQA